MDRNLKVLGDFLVDNYQDEEITSILKENFNEQVREVVRYVKDTINETVIQDIADEIEIKNIKEVSDEKEKILGLIKTNSLTPEDVIEFATMLYGKQTLSKKKDIRVGIPPAPKKREDGSPAPPPLPFKKKVEEKRTIDEKLLHNIKVIKKLEEPRKTRTAKMFAMILVGLVDKSLKAPEGAVRVTMRKTDEKTGETEIAQTRTQKGLNNPNAVRHEVERIVKTEGNTISRELERIDEMMKDERSAKIYCGILFSSFMQQYEGAGKKKQFDDAFKVVASKEKEIESAIKNKTDFQVNQKEMVEWNNLNTFIRVKEIKDYSEDKSKLTLSQIKAVVKGLKNSNYQALEIVDTLLGGKEDKSSSGSGQTKQRSGQE